ncbi:2-phosphosulfolactate phosphatase [Metallumcola ferriviriculae]|uniref:Probable 2-phosphosulfolactate phosphatase n=1 Tax=Metallumcola ferriviriculae TaxID=3039180 RepID=A0AAU0UJ48_9FIRM|nr:2-phosphosulfolactate phosphatase [Desulfitibacteraceae bacterium MK1]
MDITLIMRSEDINNLKGRVAVVIDVLRATSTMVTALRNGAEAVVPFLSPEDARAFFQSHDGDYLMCGERGGVKLPGFHLGNSPLEYRRDVIAGKTLLMTTTNGTRAIRGCEAAEEVLIGSTLNAHAVAKRIKEIDKSAALVCAGTKGNFSLDDFAAAGAIIKYLTKMCKVSLADSAQAALLLTEQHNLRSIFNQSLHGQRLVELGFEKDVDYCSQLATMDLIAEFDGVSIHLI